MKKDLLHQSQTASLIHMMDAARAGGKIVVQYFGQQLTVEQKSTTADFRTKADLESEVAIVEILKERFPHVNIQGEEYGLVDRQSDHTLIVDPLDGSNNFVLGLADFSVIIALVNDAEGTTEAAVIYQPMLNQMYSAQRGRGARLNGRSIYVREIWNMDQAWVSYTCGYDNPVSRQFAMMSALGLSGVQRVLNGWSPGVEFALLASGKIDAIVNDGNERYDFVAGKLIAREAGAMILGLDGQLDYDDLNDHFVAGNSFTATRLIPRLVK